MLSGFYQSEKKAGLAGYIEKYPNLLLLKSFTKLYGLPGIRLGYLLGGDKLLLERIRKAGQTWSVNSLAQKAGIAALKETDFVERTVSYVEEEREYLRQELLRCGFLVSDGQANYLFFRGMGQEDLYERMLKQRIILRKCSNYIGLLPGDYRIGVRSREENRYFIKVLKQVLRGKE